MKSLYRVCVPILAALAVSLPLHAQAALPAATLNRITAPIDDQNLVALRGNVHPMVQARFDRGGAPSSMPTGRIMLLLQRSAAQQQALTQYLSDVQNPGSPSYHKWLTPAQYGAAYGVSDSDLQTLQSWLAGQGFKVEKVPQARNLIEFSGTTGQIQTAFHTSIHTFSVLGQTHYANVSDPEIPAALAPVVAAVTPLNDFRPKPHVVKGGSGYYDAATGTLKPDLTLFNGSGTPFLFVDPADAATIYDTPNTNLNANFTTGTTYDGTGINIGIVGVSDLTLPDVQNYRVAFLGETSTTVNLPTVIVDGNDPGLNGAGVETILDNEVSGAIAPKAKLYYYAGADTDLTSGLYNTIIRAIDDNTVSILSMSYGECEAGLGSGGNSFLFEAAQQAAAQGISWVVSAGDGGSAGCDDFDTETQAQYGFGVSGMASTPWTIAVGGTDFDALPASFSTYANATSSGTAPYYRTALKYIPENPWNDSTTVNTALANNVRYINSEGEGNIVAGSGGVSSCSQQSSTACLGGYAKPAFQTSLTPADGVRDIPDISLFAANGYEQAMWLICSDNVTDGDPFQTYTNCQTSGGQLESGTSFDGVGGTSASAPAFAGMLALVAQAQGGARLGQANTILYQLAKSKYATVFHDVTVGNNSVPCVAASPNCGTNGFLTGYNAGTGYDLATGLGSVDVNQLVQNWGSVALTSTSTSFNINGSTAAYTGVHGKSVTFNVGVTPAAATGAAAVIDTANETAGGAVSGPQNNGQVSIPLTSGAGSVSYNGLPGGTYTVSARYGGDTSDAASTSTPAISVTISPEASTTALEVNAYNGLTGAGLSGLTSVPYGSYVIADAQITGTAEGANTEGIATGTVTFTDGGTTLGTASVSGNGNLASWPPLTSSFVVLAPGAHSIAAKYSGDPSFNASTSSSVAVTVAKAATSMTAQSSTNSVAYNFLTPTAQVTITTPYNLGNPPTGTVTMTANGTTVGTISNLTTSLEGTSLSSLYYAITGYGTINGNLLAPGNNTVTLTYTGDANYASATATLSFTSSVGLGSFTLANSGNLTLVAGQSGTNTLTVTPAGGFYSPVNFTCASTGPVTCSAPPVVLNGASSTVGLSVSSAPGATPGTYPVAVTGTDYTGKITAQTTFNVTLTALPGNAGIGLTNSGPLTINAGATNQPAIVTVTPTNGYVGNVNLTCAVTTNLSSPSSPPTCTPGPPVSVTSSLTASGSCSIGTASTTTTGAYTVTVTGTDATNAAITASTPIALTVSAPLVPTIALSSGGYIDVTPGLTGTTWITVTPGGGFTGTVNLRCALTSSPSGATDPPTCSITGSANITDTNSAANAPLNVSTTAASSALDLPLKKYFVGGGGAVMVLVLFFGIPARRRAWRSLFMALALVVIAGAVGCGGGGNSGGGGNKNPGTTAGSYTVTVTGTDAATGKITSSVAVTVTVN